MDARETVLEYYEALRRGEPLYPYFAEHPDVVKFGINERLTGYDEIAEGLRDQARTTGDWTVDSAALRVVERETHAWFSDDVSMTWTDVEAGHNHAFESRWSGTLEPRLVDSDAEWLFVGMHVSAPHRLSGVE